MLGFYKLTLLVIDQKVIVIQIPQLFEEMKSIQGTLSKIEEWSNPAPRANTFFNNPTPFLPGRHSTPKPADTSNKEISKAHLF